MGSIIKTGGERGGDVRGFDFERDFALATARKDPVAYHALSGSIAVIGPLPSGLSAGISEGAGMLHLFGGPLSPVDKIAGSAVIFPATLFGGDFAKVVSANAFGGGLLAFGAEGQPVVDLSLGETVVAAGAILLLSLVAVIIINRIMQEEKNPGAQPARLPMSGEGINLTAIGRPLDSQKGKGPTVPPVTPPDAQRPVSYAEFASGGARNLAKGRQAFLELLQRRIESGTAPKDRADDNIDTASFSSPPPMASGYIGSMVPRINIPPERREFLDGVYNKALQESSASYDPQKIWWRATIEFVTQYQIWARNTGLYEELAKELENIAASTYTAVFSMAHLLTNAALIYSKGGFYEKAGKLQAKAAQLCAEDYSYVLEETGADKNVIEMSAFLLLRAADNLVSAGKFSYNGAYANYLADQVEGFASTLAIQTMVALLIGAELERDRGPLAMQFYDRFERTIPRDNGDREALISRILLAKKRTEFYKKYRPNLRGPKRLLERAFIWGSNLGCRITSWADGYFLRDNFGIEPEDVTIESFRKD